MVKAVIFDMYETLITLFQSPLYFGTQMAQDAKISEEEFLKLWTPMEHDRTIGKLSLEEALETILRENQCYTKKLLETIVQKRMESKEESFHHLNPEIIPMLQQLKDSKLKIGLISNCYSEEAKVIRRSILFPYFDHACLSYEQGVKKPDIEIFRRCIDGLDVKAEECLYIGDGGSYELETAKEIGMFAAQAVWYLQDGTMQPCQRKDGFLQLERPLDVIRFLDK